MTTTKKFITPCFLFASILMTSACNNSSEPAKTEEYFLKEKLETIKKAEAVDQLVQDAAKMQRRTIDEQSE